MKYIEIPENMLYQYPQHNLYFEKNNGFVGVYWKNNKAIFEQYSIEDKFDDIVIISENGISEQKYNNYDDLPFENSIPENKNKEKCSEEIEKRIAELQEALIGPKSCYVLIVYNNGNACIKELVNNRIVIESFNINHYKRIWNGLYSGLYNDLIQLCDSEKKYYALLSLRHGYLFGPYYFKKIENYNCGVILDDRFYIGHLGEVIDAAEYEKYIRKHLVLLNKKKEICYILIDGFDRLLLLLTKKESDVRNKIYCTEIGNNLYKFDEETTELHVEREYSFTGEWTDEDAWDAMTDGQYGDYLGPGWDMERFGY